MALRDRPLVSVLMPAYNGEKYIEEAVRSVLAQSLFDFELVLIDDCSQDRTWELAANLAREDERIRLYRNGCNLGPARTRNRGLDLCRGDYVALLDCDDVWHPEKLEKQVALARETKADIVYCGYAIVDRDGRKCCRDFAVPESTDVKSTLVKSVISCSTALLGKRVTEHYRFPVDYYHEDLALWLLLLENGMKAVGTPEILARYRIHPDSRACEKLKVARRRWRLYRSMLGLPVGKSTYYFLQYAREGVRKYRRCME